MTKGLLGLEIAERTIRYVYLVKDKGKYLIEKAGQMTSKTDLSTKDTLSAEINQLIASEQLSVQRIYATIARRDVVIHQVVLPKMNQSELDEAISAEIAKIPAFYQRNFEYVFKNYPQEGGKNKVVFAALASSTLQSMVQEIRKTGIPFGHLDIAPLNFKELLNRINPARPVEAFLVISEHHTYLAVYHKERYGLVYKSSVGIGQFSAFGSLSIHDQVISNWTAELKRAIKAYLLETQQSKVDLVWLAWDKTRIPDLDQKIAKDLEAEVEVLYTKKIPGLKITDEKNLNPVFVQALLPIAFTTLKIKPQFPFDYFIRTLNISRFIAQTVLVAAIFIFLSIGAFGSLIYELRSETAKLVAQEVAMEQEIKKLTLESKSLMQKYDDYMQVKKRLLMQATYVQNLNRVAWTQVLSICAKELPEDMALTSFSLREDGSASFEGDALRMEPVSELLRRIKSSQIMQDGKFNFLHERKIKEQKIYNFGILAKLRNPEVTEK